MKKIQNLVFSELVIENEVESIYRAIDKNNQSKYLVKELKPNYKNIHYTQRIENELELGKKVKSKFILKPIQIINENNSLCILSENAEGLILSELINDAQTNLKIKLKIAICLSEAISDVHKNKLIHKSLHPDKIIINEEFSAAKILNLRFATVNKETNFANSSQNLIGIDPKYISPEQTGRMNRSTDHRTDLYTLGVILYELFSGKVPFNSENPSEIVYKHIAQQQDAFDENVPKIIEEIIWKLLEKNPSKRYQSARTVKKDLESCLLDFNTSGECKYFEIGKKDISANLTIPETIYGREKEKQKIINSYISSSDGEKSICVLHGRSGTGKTSLVKNLQHDILSKKGYFAEGKFNKFSSNNPFSGFVDAIKILTQALLTENKDYLKSLANSIKNTLPTNNKVLFEYIPELKHILGELSITEKESEEDLQNQFSLSMTKLIQSIASKEKPLVLFFDDIQWVDQASYELIKNLSTNQNIKHLLIILAIRTNNSDENKSILNSIKELERINCKVHKIEIETIGIENTAELLQDTLHCDFKKIYGLAKSVHLKTKGNPFYIKQFIRNLTSKNIIQFDFDKSSWRWDQKKIDSMNYTDNTAHYVIEIIQKLPPKILELLKSASCIGVKFDLKTLSLINKMELRSTAINLNYAIREGLITPINEPTGFNNESFDELNFTYKFLHNNIHLAIYSLQSEKEKQEVHFNIGVTIENNCTPDQLKDHIFNVVTQKNLGSNILSKKEDFLKLASQNLQAGLKAKQSSAYKTAIEYLKSGIKCLLDYSWKETPDLKFNLWIEAAKAEYLTGNIERTSILINEILANIQDPNKISRAYIVLIQAFKATNNYAKALNTGIEALKILGLKVPKKPKKSEILNAYLKLKILIGRKTNEDILKLPEMTGINNLSLMEVLSTMLPTAYIASPELLPILTFKKIQLTLKYGHAPSSAHAFVVFGHILAHNFDKIDEGINFGILALKSLVKFKNIKQKAKVYFNYNIALSHLRNHLSETLNPFYKAYLNGLEYGDIEYGGNSIAMYLVNSFFSCKKLDELDQEFIYYQEHLSDVNQYSNLFYLKSFHKTINELKTGNQQNLYNSDEILEFHKNGSDDLGIFTVHLNKLIRSYFSNEYLDAEKSATSARKYINSSSGLIYTPIFYFFDSLTRLTILTEEIGHKKERKWLKIIKANQKYLKNLSEFAPANYLSKYLLIEAVLHFVYGDSAKSYKLFNESILHSTENNYLYETAIANTLLGKILISKGNDKGKNNILRAYNNFIEWGATALAQNIEKEHHEILIDASKKISHKVSEASQILLKPLTSENIDLNTIIEASQAITEETNLDNLLKKLLSITIKNIGATKGIILLNEVDETNIKAIQTELMKKPLIVDSKHYTSSKDLSHEIINYVARTSKPVVLHNAEKDNEFTKSPYILSKKPKSILCQPIIYRGIFRGILYFENNLSTNAFTSSKLEILNLLNGHISISIENALFYTKMEQKVIERTAEIEQQKEEIIVQAEHLKLVNTDLEEKNVKINQQKKEIEEQSVLLEQKNQELKKLLIAAQKTDNAIIIADNKGEIEWVNEGFERKYGYNLQDFKSKISSNLMSASTNPDIEEIIKTIISSKKSISYNSKGITKVNEELWMRTTVTPILDESGELSKLVAIDSDITKLIDAENEILKQKEEIESQRDLANEQKLHIQDQNKELEQHRNQLERLVDERTSELKIAKEKAEESDRLKSSFLANMSHEIRTPMNAIIGFSDLISDESIGGSQRRELANHLNSNCNSLLHLIDDILDIARIEAGELRIYKKDCYINQTMIELYETFVETEIKDKPNIELLVDAENTDENLSIYSDPFRFRQILINLISNAIKFTEKGHIKFGYKIEPEGYDGFVKFYVEDTGIGLNKKEQTEIFHQFRKANSVNKNKLYRGAGLGLAISKSLINKLGGEIWVDSKKDLGSTFSFTLPFVKSSIKHENQQADKEFYNWRNKNILIAEDEESNVRMLDLMLSKTKVNLIYAIDGLQAIDKCKNEQIDLVLMDIKMPEKNGLEATKEIRKFNNKLPILAFSAYAMPEDQLKAKDAGCDKFIAKPVKKDLLLETINQYLCN